MKKFGFALVSLLVTAAVFAQTSPSRVAVIDVRKVLLESTAGKASFERLSKMQADRAAQAQKMNEELGGLESELKQKQMSLSQEKLAELNKQFTDKKVALTRYAQDAERELGEARDRELSNLEKQIIPVINEVGKEMGFALIFNRQESGLVYASDAIDITSVVIQRFNGASTAKAPAK